MELFIGAKLEIKLDNQSIKELGFKEKSSYTVFVNNIYDDKISVNKACQPKNFFINQNEIIKIYD